MTPLRGLKIPNDFAFWIILRFLLYLKAFVDLTRDIFLQIQSGDIKIQDSWEGVKSGFVPNIINSSEEVTKGNHQWLC